MFERTFVGMDVHARSVVACEEAASARAVPGAVAVGVDEGGGGVAAVVDVPPPITGSAATPANTMPRAPVSRTTPASMAPATRAT